MVWKILISNYIISWNQCDNLELDNLALDSTEKKVLEQAHLMSPKTSKIKH